MTHFDPVHGLTKLNTVVRTYVCTYYQHHLDKSGKFIGGSLYTDGALS